jgi:Helix-loop-helix DNA-binding domain
LEEMDNEDQSNETNTATAKKRTRETETDEDAELEGLSPGDLAKLSRSERKRHREKKRRSDVNKGFDELMTLLLEIDPTVRAEAEERARRGQWKGSFGAHEDNLLSRVDLISRAVEVLRRIHRENEERKHIIASLTRSGAGSTLGLGTAGVGVGIGGMGGPLSRDRAAAASDEVSLPFFTLIVAFVSFSDRCIAISFFPSNF